MSGRFATVGMGDVMLTLEVFAKGIGYLSLVFDRGISEERSRAYYHLLKSLTDAQFRVAVEQVAKKELSFPFPAKIREYVPAAAPPIVPSIEHKEQRCLPFEKAMARFCARIVSEEMSESSIVSTMNEIRSGFRDTTTSITSGSCIH